MTDSERPYLRETLESVRSQTVPCKVILVVLDSNEWIDGLLKEFPEVKLIRRGPGWAGAARNDGVLAATTEFVAFLDGDDVWRPRKTEQQAAFLCQSKQEFVAVDHILITQQGDQFAYALARYLPMPSSWMVRRETMLREPFDPTVGFGLEDAEWWLRTWYSVNKCRLPRALIGYRVRGQSASSLTPSKRRKLSFAKWSALPAVRPFLLMSTYFIHMLTRRSGYLVAKGWKIPPKPLSAKI